MNNDSEQSAENDAACSWCHYGDPHPAFSSCARNPIEKCPTPCWMCPDPCPRDPRVIPPVDNDAPEPLCSECGMPGQCAACYLMESRGIPTPPRVISPAGTDA